VRRCLLCLFLAAAAAVVIAVVLRRSVRRCLLCPLPCGCCRRGGDGGCAALATPPKIFEEVVMAVALRG